MGGGIGAVRGRGWHHSSAKACDPEITGSRLICSTACASCSVAGRDRKLPCLQGLIVLLLTSNGEQPCEDSSVHEEGVIHML